MVQRVLCMNKNISYNFLSLLNVILGFLTILFLGRKFGANNQTDIYFLSVVIIGYIGYFIQSLWEAIIPYYSEVKINRKNISKIYSIFLNNIIFFSVLIILLYFLQTKNFSLVKNDELKTFLDIYIFFIIFQNILLFNKIILNLEKYFASFYLVDIFINAIILVVLIFIIDNKILYLSYTIVVSTFFANLIQFYLIFKKLNISYSVCFYEKEFNDIYKFNKIKIRWNIICDERHNFSIYF